MLDSSTPVAAMQFNSQAIVMFSMIAFLPAILLAMTAFTRVYIVLSILRQAIGIINAPSNQILLGIALMITFFVMHPMLNQLSSTVLQPYMKQQLSLEHALEKSQQPFEAFMSKHTREKDIKLYQRLTPNQEKNFVVTMAAFLTSELRAAFQIGFMIYIPFLIVDLVVAGVLMSMGMIMVSPLAISLPFKLLLFVAVDGWGLLFGSLIESFMV